jgi:Delta3-Delta2-enoyl-CoA isomerase
MAQAPADAQFPGLSLSYPAPGVAHLSICSPPANALDLPLWQALTAALRHAESDGRTSVLIISSGLERPVFSAGNDITELHAPSTSEDRFREFWAVSNSFLASLYASPLWTIAAIRGACPAGGCVMALCCDERIVLCGHSFVFGLNEAALGIPVPRYWARLMLAISNFRPEIERMLYGGRMVDAEGALRLGLVDRLIDGDAEDLIGAAYDVAAAAAVAAVKVGGGGVGARQTKSSVRGEFTAEWQSYIEEEAAESWNMLSKADISKQLGHFLNELRKRAGPKL